MSLSRQFSQIPQINLTTIRVSKNNKIKLNMPNYLANMCSTDGKYEVNKAAGLMINNRFAHNKLKELLNEVINEFDSNSWNISLVTIKNNNRFPKKLENKMIEIAKQNFKPFNNKKEYFIDTKKRPFKDYLLYLSRFHNIKFDKVYRLKENYIVDENIDYSSESEEDNDGSDYSA